MSSVATTVLEQRFPLGRFHATPWRVNPYDDPYGEWPPSPWRLVRAVVARWYQWRREASGSRDEAELEALVQALCAARYTFHLPVAARRGAPLRQYHPMNYQWVPAQAKYAAMRCYNTSLVQDNCWLVPEDEAVWWFLQGGEWHDELLEVLDRCLERITYFGRAEALTVIRRAEGAPDDAGPNVRLNERREDGTAPVLCPTAEATLAEVEGISDQPQLRGVTIPPGACWRFATLPEPSPLRGPRRTVSPRRESTVVQFAIGGAVLPDERAITRLTDRFRGRVIRRLARRLSGDPSASWGKTSRSVKDRMALVTGKDAGGRALQGHRHASFAVWPRDGQPARLVVWRPTPFDQDEEAALLEAAMRDLSWAPRGGPAEDQWRVRLVPLDSAVPPPAGFDGCPARMWRSVTPYVPPRHRFRRGGKPRDTESVAAQVSRELAARDFTSQPVEVAEIDRPRWVAVHLPYRERRSRQTLGDRMGFVLELGFAHPVRGPLALGHSATYGLGLFEPVGGG